MSDELIAGPVFRLLLYIIPPLIVRYGFTDAALRMSNGKKLLLSVVWSAIATFIAVMVFSYGQVYWAEALGEIAGGTMIGALIADSILSVKIHSKDDVGNKAQTTSDRNPVKAEEAGISDSIMMTSEAIEGSIPEELNTNNGKSTEKGTKTDGFGAVDAVTEYRDLVSYVVPDEELRALKKLHESGILTDEEFKEKKKMLLKI